jgi:hypothetical protein
VAESLHDFRCWLTDCVLSSSRRFARFPQRTEALAPGAHSPVATNTLAAMGIPDAIGNRYSPNHYCSRGPEAGERYAPLPLPTSDSGCELQGSQALAGCCAIPPPNWADEPAASCELQLGD